MNIVLKKLSLLNFKGVTNFDIVFTTDDTQIFGANRSGKTSLYDAFLWLLFDKDSSGRKDFQIKTLDGNGLTNSNLEHSVEGTFEIDGKSLILKKSYREKWARKRGYSESEFIGNETIYCWHGTTIKKDEFMSRINANITDEDTFRLLSDVRYFNTLTWQQRRQMLFSLVDDASVVENKELATHLEGNNYDDVRRNFASAKKKFLLEIDQCPIRINEITRSLPPLEEPEDVTLIDSELESLESSSSSAFTLKVRTLNHRKHELFSNIDDRKTQLRDSFRMRLRDNDQMLLHKKNSLEGLRSQFTQLYNSIEVLKRTIEISEGHLSSTRAEYSAETAKRFEGVANCPVCDSKLPEVNFQQYVDKFNENKSKRLNELSIIGINARHVVEEHKKILAKTIDEANDCQSDISDTNDAITQYTKAVETIRNEGNEEFMMLLTVDTEIVKYQDEVNLIDTELKNYKESTSGVDHKQRLVARRDHAISVTNDMLHRKTQLDRITEIENARSVLLDKTSNVERLEYELEKFIKQKIANVELQLKNMFDGVSFKMFETQINGNVSDTCVVLRDGVPYSDLNTASKIWISLSIISTFSKVKNLQVPIFIDNRESITTLPVMSQQTISLIVSPEHKSLTIKK